MSGPACLAALLGFGFLVSAGGSASAGAGSADAGPPTSSLADGGAADGGGVGDAGLPAVGDGGPAVAPHAPLAKTTAVHGTVLARGTREPLPGAAISIDAAPVTEAGENGAFALDLRPGLHHLQLQAPGFEPADVKLDVGDTPLVLTIRLTPRLTGERYETVVTARSDEPAITIEKEDLTRTAGSLGEPFRIIESLPGVSQVAWPLALYAVRGANPGNTGFFIDGIRLPALFHFALGPAVIHPYFLGGLDFYPGGYPVQYGRFVSGVVAATTAEPKPDHPRGSVDVRLFDAGAIVATPFDNGKGALAVAGRYSYTALLFSLLSPNYTLQYWDYQVRVDHVLGPGKLTLFAFGSHDQLANKQYADTDAQIDFHRLDVRWQGTVGPGRLLVGSSIGLDASAVSLDPVVKLPVHIHTRNAAPRINYFIPGQRLGFQIGGDGEIDQLRPTSERATPDQDLFRNRVAVSIGAFSALTWRPTPDVEVQPGLRYDFFFEGGAHRAEPEPRLLLRYRPGGQTWLQGQIGRYAQMASLPVAVPGFENFGLPTLGTQTSKQVSVGIQQGLGDELSIDVTGYYQRLRLTDLLSVFNYDPQDPRLLELRDGESHGVEVMIRRPSSHRFYGWLSYTLSWSERLVGSSQSKYWSDWDQRHVANLVLGYRFRGGYSIGGRFHLNTGRPYPLFDDDHPAPPDYVRLPTFYQVDLRAEKRFIFDRYVLDVYLEAVNTTLSRQVFDEKLTMGVVDERAYRIVLPSIGVHAEW